MAANTFSRATSSNERCLVSNRRADISCRWGFRALAVLALSAALWSPGCSGGASPQPPPVPPRPGPVEPPAPLPPRPTPTPSGHIVMQAEFEAVPAGSTEAAVRALFGAPVQAAPLPQEGVEMSLLYRASTPADATRWAEFWFRAGVLVNKVLY